MDSHDGEPPASAVDRALVLVVGDGATAADLAGAVLAAPGTGPDDRARAEAVLALVAFRDGRPEAGRHHLDQARHHLARVTPSPRPGSRSTMWRATGCGRPAARPRRWGCCAASTPWPPTAPWSTPTSRPGPSASPCRCRPTTTRPWSCSTRRCGWPAAAASWRWR